MERRMGGPAPRRGPPREDYAPPARGGGYGAQKGYYEQGGCASPRLRIRPFVASHACVAR